MVSQISRMLLLSLVFTGVIFSLYDVAMAVEQDTPEEIVGVEVRRQGYDCQNPRNAQRDSKRSTPNETVWELTCDEGIYRVTLKPNLGTANVDILREKKDDK